MELKHKQWKSFTFLGIIMLEAPQATLVYPSGQSNFENENECEEVVE
jgi:hypothetical protein